MKNQKPRPAKKRQRPAFKITIGDIIGKEQVAKLKVWAQKNTPKTV